MASDQGRTQGAAERRWPPGVQARLSAEASERAIENDGRMRGDHAATHARLAQAYATMGLSEQVAELKTIVNDRLTEVSNFLDAVAKAIMTHD